MNSAIIAGITRPYLKMMMATCIARTVMKIERSQMKPIRQMQKQLDPDHVFTCSGCGESIRHGQTYLDIMGEQFCRVCVIKSSKIAKKENKEEAK